MPDHSAARIGWHADRTDTKLASVRYRMLAPLEALRDAGMPIEIFDGTRAPGSYDTIVFCKSQSAAALDIATAARAAGTTVIYDVCDNLFEAHRVGHASAARIERVTALMTLADHITFSTATLAEQIMREIAIDAPFTVIADALDIMPPTTPPPGLRERIELGRLRRFLRRHHDALHCVWFGKSLGQVSGYVHVADAVEQLRVFARAAPVTLTVISNDRVNFWRSARRWKLPLHYTPWTLATASDAIAIHRAAVIPLEHNDYTAGKTINRPATALLLGLGVIADTIPSYEELRPFVALDDWQGGLRRYRDWSPETQHQLAEGRAYLADRYSPAAVAARWAALFDAVQPERR